MAAVRRPLIALIAVALVLAACAGNELDASSRERSTTTRPRPTTTAPSDSTTTTPLGPTPTAPSTPTTGSGFPDGWMPEPLVWSRCEGRAGFECATLRVPLYWDNPEGDQVALAVARQPASSARRIGSLLTNPGGPGASGREFLFGEPFAAELRERFDLVSWDPRGVGASTHLFCGSKVETFLHLDPDPGDAA